MPAVKWSTVLKLARNLSVSLNVDFKMGRGSTPVPNGRASKPEEKPGVRAKGADRKARELNQIKKSLDAKDKRIAQLEKKLEKSEAISSLESVSYEGVVLPSRHLRPCGARFQEDDFYFASAKSEANRLVENLGLTEKSCLLDVGAGPGRIAIGILSEIGEIKKYRGVDVSEPFVHWGQKHIQSKHPQFQFLHVDVENSRYNPDGSRINTDFALPFSKGEFDIVCLYSVFTHMLTEDVRAYLNEFNRILKLSGKIFLTAFVETGVPNVSENPKGYLGREWRGSLHCVRYERRFFESLLAENGFRIDGYASEKQEGQQGLYISRKDVK